MRIDDAGHGCTDRSAHSITGLLTRSKAVPTVVLRNEDYGRIERLMADGEDVKLEFNIVNHWYPAGATSYNVVAEIPGPDRADEL